MSPHQKIELFKSKCISAFGGRLECLVLTGSYARGDYTASSDIDLWVFINNICLDDIRIVGNIVNEIGRMPEINPQCTSLEELKFDALKDQFNPIQLYIDSIILHGSLPGPAPSHDEIRNYASSVASFGLMSARHYISVQESEESLAKGKLMKWVLQPLMWALRYKVLCNTSKYPRTIDDLLCDLHEDEKGIVKYYTKIISGNFKGPYMPVIEEAEKAAIRFIYNNR